MFVFISIECQFSLNKNLSHQLQQQTIQLEQCQKRIIELELILSTLNSSNVVNQTLLTDIKQSQEIRRENEQLKKQIELLKYETFNFSLSLVRIISD